MENKALPRSLLLIMAIGTGMVVADNYYTQPLLGEIARSFHATESEVSLIPTLTQLGYASGLFFIVSLGDKFERKKLILTDLVFVIIVLIANGLATSLGLLLVASFFLGLFSVIPQLFVPMSAQLASDDKRGAAIGTVMTGMLSGVLLSRTVSGVVGAHWGWRTIFFLAAGALTVLWIVLKIRLPVIAAEFKGNYRQLLSSVVDQYRERRQLRLAAIRGALDFGAFSVFWTTLVFLLERSPFNMGSDAAGTFGFVGVAGAFAAGYIGKLADRISKNRLIYYAVFTILISWIIMGFFAQSLMGLILGALFLDLGIQSVHITNQTIIFEGNPSARNRINTVYMVHYFVGGALGTTVGGLIWSHFGWHGVCIAGFIFALGILFFNSGKPRNESPVGLMNSKTNALKL